MKPKYDKLLSNFGFNCKVRQYNTVGMGYAYLLTHPGTPCVMWDHYFDWGDDLKGKLAALLQAREAAGVHSRSKLEIVVGRCRLTPGFCS